MEAKLEPRLIVKGEAGVPYVQGEFFIASYQRGYRWGEFEVRQLLDDIKESVIDPAVKRPYYLQPVVVLRRSKDLWELVDGQQRLTTLRLILKHIKSELPSAQVNYELTYETRPGSREYLETLDRELSEDNPDFFHIAAAFKSIEKWFSEQENSLQAAIDVHTALAKWVYVIWYEAPPETNPNMLFSRLNRDRIPLTDAELIKALVLSEHGASEGRLGRQEEIAAQWDGFERDLREEQFWAFLTSSTKGRSTHIDFLFESMTRTGLDRTPGRYSTFFAVRKMVEDTSASIFWRGVVARHGLLTGWFHDRVLYHRVGYLVAVGESISDLVEASQNMTHSEFAAELDSRIRRQLNISADDMSLLQYGNGKHDAKIAKILLLMNVETVLANRDSASRFSFRAYAEGFADGKSSLEHIHAQNSDDLKSEPQWRAWVVDHEHRITSRTWEGGDREKADEIALRLREHRDAKKLNKDALAFQELVEEVFELFSEKSIASEDDMHGLANLALLQRDINSKLNNAVFDVKRERVLKLDFEGSYILPCTRNVFLKYYTASGDQQLHLWTAQDRSAYYTKMLELVADYLQPHTEEASA